MKNFFLVLFLFVSAFVLSSCGEKYGDDPTKTKEYGFNYVANSTSLSSDFESINLVIIAYEYDDEGKIIDTKEWSYPNLPSRYTVKEKTEKAKFYVKGRVITKPKLMFGVTESHTNSFEGWIKSSKTFGKYVEEIYYAFDWETFAFKFDGYSLSSNEPV